MSRKRYLVAYDVADDRRRSQVFKTLLDYGDHAQFSVFFCDLSSMEIVRLRAKLKDRIHEREDQVFLLDLGDVQNPLEGSLECLGKPYQPASRVLVL